MTDNRDLVAEFLARGGKVTKCPDGEANAIPLRVMRRRAAILSPGATEDARRARGITTIVDHCGREHARNAEGEWLY